MEDKWDVWKSEIWRRDDCLWDRKRALERSYDVTVM